jgi:thiol-disulfide isomerase/thioredoxin
MIRNLVILAILSGAVLAYTFYSERVMPAPSYDQPVAPAFSFETVDGKKHSISDFKDKVVVLNFWASWCAPCVIEFPQMISLAEKTQENSVLIFMSIDEEKADIQKFIKKHPKIAKAENIMVAHDKTKSISRNLFRTYQIPETYIIAPGGRIADKIVGADVLWDSATMVEKINSLKN